METFADYILNEEELGIKMEITYYLAKKTKIFFDKSVVFKTEIARLFLNYAKMEIDKNFIYTVCLLCNCKRQNSYENIEQIQEYAKKGSEYLSELGFGKKFCKVCEEVNRYSNSNPREKESDIIELVDQFGGMLLDRPERIGFKPDEAMVLLEHRNLKNEYNRYLNTFIDFINFMQKIEMNEEMAMTSFKRLVKMYNESDTLPKFMQKVVYEYEPKVDRMIRKQGEEISAQMLNQSSKVNNRPLFSEETTKKIMAHMNGEIGERKNV